MPDATYKGKTYDLDRVVFDRDTSWDGLEFSAGATVRDVIKDMSGIGYGGHYGEMSDEEEGLYAAAARTPNEYRWMVASRDAYCELISTMAELVEVPKVWIQ